MKELKVVEFKNERIITTKVLAESYGTDENNITKNFNNNKDRFIEGKHYYRLIGEELKEFKNLVNDIHVVNKNTASLYLWTEKGILRHSKILDTDEAWNVYEELEDTYFKTKQLALPKDKEGFEFELSLLGFTMDKLKINEGSKILMIGDFGKAHNMDTSYLPSYTSEKITKSLSELLKQFNVNMSSIKFNKLLLEKGIIIELERASSKGGIKKFKSIANEEFGKNLLSTSNQKETQPHYYEDKFQELINLVI